MDGNEQMAMADKQPEYFDIANKMAQEIVERYNPDVQNEIVKYIKNFVTEQRKAKIESAAKELEYLKKTLEDIGA